MFKKPQGTSVVRRKLFLRPETLTQLTPLQLEKVVGGFTIGSPNCRESQEKMCDNEPI